MIADDVRIVALAGLIHDVGKVFEPARIPLDPAQARLESVICPVDRSGRPTHRHVLWTAYVLDRVECDWGGLDRGAVFRAACYHHRPSSGQLLEHLVTRADRLASGHDRRPRPEEEAQRQVTGLISPLAGLGNRTVNESAPIYLAAGSAGAPAAAVLPAASMTRENYARSCAEVAGSILRDLAEVKGSSAWCVERMDAVARTHLSSVPASRAWTESPDTSLYDHSRAVAALAACLAAQNIEVPFVGEEAIEGRFSLVTLRLKGIQSFIFRRFPPPDTPGGTDKGRARELRARSFYASLLMTDAARAVAHAAGVPATNILINAGGSATVLVPGTPIALANVQRSVMELLGWFTQWFGGVLRLEVGASAPIPERALAAENFSTSMRELEAGIIASRGHAVPDALRRGSWSGSGWVGDHPGLPSDRLAERLQEFGRSLPRAKAVRFRPDHGGDLPLPRGSLVLLDHDPGPAAEGCFVLSHRDEPSRPVVTAAAYVPRVAAEVVSRPVTDEPLCPGDPVPFGELALKSTADDGEAVGGEMLGVLKADVDRLGYLFAYGLSGRPGEVRSRASLGRLAAVSRAFDDFFKGLLDAKLHTEYYNIYTVFAGGDDLFLVGPWHDIARLARDLHGWFDRFACNPSQPRGASGSMDRITLSAAVAFFKPQVPVRVLASVSDDLLEQAKNSGRDRIAFGHTILTWDQYSAAWEWHRDMLAFARGSHGGGNGLIRSVLEIARSARAGVSSGSAPLRSLKWRSQLSYLLARRSRHEREGAGAALYERLVCTTHEELAALDVGAVLTLYRMRGEAQ
jgi:HD domain.